MELDSITSYFKQKVGFLKVGSLTWDWESDDFLRNQRTKNLIAFLNRIGCIR